MAICSGNDQIRTVLFRHVIEVTRVRFIHVDTHVSFAFHAMTLQIFGDIADTPSRQILFIRRANLENRHVRRLSEKRHRHGSQGGPLSCPSNLRRPDPPAIRAHARVPKRSVAPFGPEGVSDSTCPLRYEATRARKASAIPARRESAMLPPPPTQGRRCAARRTETTRARPGSTGTSLR